jgi:hypothetical protein
VIVDAKPKALGLPTDAYYSVEEVHDVSPPTSCAKLALTLCSRN